MIQNRVVSSIVSMTKMCWRIERDYQVLKQKFGLGYYEGDGWWLPAHPIRTLDRLPDDFFVDGLNAYRRYRQAHNQPASVTLPNNPGVRRRSCSSTRPADPC
ncbi:hypothetical protein BN2476_2100005 [Paraburkholderia piptadeniae]|uniref:Transposase n=2 Tax=Paraburkholderia TaxID=1822464 RepID=A0A7X1TLD2_9BURK|nr:hypothetical protein [Paraburkholderia franconis]SIT52165.1 hypothetical protein BN2476_2100005 [Paraburkholderia piptadeniae]